MAGAPEESCLTGSPAWVPPKPPPPPPPSPPRLPLGWRATALLLRLFCVALLAGMFGLKVSDYLQEQVTTSVHWEPAALPFVTVCPGGLNSTVMYQETKDRVQSRDTIDSLLRRAALQLSAVLVSCVTVDGRSCQPRDAGGEFGWGRWRRVLYPPGLTCYTLQTRLVDGANSELQIALRLDSSIMGINGYYRVFVHGNGTAKTFYGGGIVSAYYMVREAGHRELSLSLSEIVQVNRRRSRCQADPDFDQNQYLQDCRSRAAFLSANCSVSWGSPAPDVPPCDSLDQYNRLQEAWRHVAPVCSCPTPCVHRQVTLTEHQTMLLATGDVIYLQLRFPYRKQVLEERRSYQLVDLLTDLGGTMGLLLGYSLSSLIDIGDMIVMTVMKARRR